MRRARSAYLNASNTFSSSALGTPRPELSISTRSLLAISVGMAARTCTLPFSLKRTALMMTAVMACVMSVESTKRRGTPG